MRTKESTKILLIKAGLTVTQLSKIIGYSRTTIYKAINEPKKHHYIYKLILDTCKSKM